MFLIFLPHLLYIKPYLSSIFNENLHFIRYKDLKNTNKSKCMGNSFHKKEASVLSTVLKKVGSISNLWMLETS